MVRDRYHRLIALTAVLAATTLIWWIQPCNAVSDDPPPLNTRPHASGGEGIATSLDEPEDLVAGRSRDERTSRQLAQPIGEHAISQGLSLHGVAVDDLGFAIEKFSVYYRLVSDIHGPDAGELQHHTFQHPGGAFVIGGLRRGNYRIQVLAEHHLPSAELEVATPFERLLPAISLMRAARIKGIVLTPHGYPAAMTEVYRDGGMIGFHRWDVRYMAVSGRLFQHIGISDSNGIIDVEAPPGAIRLRASLSGYSSTEALSLTLEPGEVLEGVELRLRPGATLTGVLLDSKGNGVAGGQVQIRYTAGEFEATLSTDEEGAFQVSGLDYGLYHVTAHAGAAELPAPATDALNGVLTCRTEIEVGASSAHVVLAFPSQGSVRVAGVVSANGIPVEARVSVNLQNGVEPIVSESDGSGSYEVIVPAPGLYTFTIRLRRGGASINASILIQNTVEEHLDIDMLVGSIGGHVYGPDGPLNGAKIICELSELPDGSPGWGHATARADEHGYYQIDNLPAGIWSLRTITSQHGKGPAEPDEVVSYTPARVEGVAVLGGESVREVNLFVAIGGTLTGRVLTTAGIPAKGAKVIVRLLSGASVEHSPLIADAAGTFVLPGLLPGEYLISAQFGSNQGAEQAIWLQQGVESGVELSMSPASMIRVIVLDRGENPLPCRVRCHRLDGRDYSALLDWPVELAETSSRAEHFGPLLPGTYLVSAECVGRQIVTRCITLSGEAEVLVELIP